MASGKRTLKPIQMPGSVKQSFSAEQTPRLKEMTSVYRDQSTLKLHGNRMAVPPLKSFEPVATVREIKVNSPVKSACKSDSSSSTKSQDSTEKMELKEAQAKEKRLNQKIEELNKIIADLKKKIKEKDKIITKANDLIKSQEEEFKSRLLKETQSHIQTKCLLDEKIEQLAKSQSEFKSLKEVHEQKVKNLEEQKEKDLLKLRFEKDKEIASRDEKLAKLKKQMADVLMGNSKERQQQLEELTRELSRMQEEIETLNFKLKSYRSKQKTSCPGCKDLTDEVNKMQTLSTSQDETIKELQVLCAKLEIQLETQDDLLKQWPQSPGRKPSKPP